MRDRLVSKLSERYLNTCILIIRILPEAGLGVNEVISQTSIKDRTHIIDAIRVLEKAKFLTKDKAPHGKLRNLKLTELGNRVKTFLDNVEIYINSYKNLRRKMDEIEQDMDIELGNEFAGYEDGYKVLKGGRARLGQLLVRKGWKKEETQRWFNGLTYLLGVSKTDGVFASLYRLMALNKLEANEISKAIIQKVILEGLSKQLQLFVSESISHNSYENLYSGIYAHIEELFGYDLISCGFISKDFKSYIRSLIGIGDSSGSIMRSMVDPLKKKIENLNREMSTKPDVDNRLLIKANENLLSFYEEKFRG
jgi:hypothetical protein